MAIYFDGLTVVRGMRLSDILSTRRYLAFLEQNIQVAMAENNPLCLQFIIQFL